MSFTGVGGTEDGEKARLFCHVCYFTCKGAPFWKGPQLVLG
jgi:hypothetical protein